MMTILRTRIIRECIGLTRHSSLDSPRSGDLTVVLKANRAWNEFAVQTKNYSSHDTLQYSTVTLCKKSVRDGRR
jgi:hypothetical protein